MKPLYIAQLILNVTDWWTMAAVVLGMLKLKKRCLCATYRFFHTHQRKKEGECFQGVNNTRRWKVLTTMKKSLEGHHKKMNNKKQKKNYSF